MGQVNSNNNCKCKFKLITTLKFSLFWSWFNLLRKFAWVKKSLLIRCLEHFGIKLEIKEWFFFFSFENPVELERHHVFHLEQEFKDIDKVRIRRVRGERGEVGSKLRRLRSETYSRLKERRERRRLLSSSLGQPGLGFKFIRDFFKC